MHVKNKVTGFVCPRIVRLACILSLVGHLFVPSVDAATVYPPMGVYTGARGGQSGSVPGWPSAQYYQGITGFQTWFGHQIPYGWDGGNYLTNWADLVSTMSFINSWASTDWQCIVNLPMIPLLDQTIWNDLDLGSPGIAGSAVLSN